MGLVWKRKLDLAPIPVTTVPRGGRNLGTANLIGRYTTAAPKTSELRICQCDACLASQNTDWC